MKLSAKVVIHMDVDQTTPWLMKRDRNTEPTNQERPGGDDEIVEKEKNASSNDEGDEPFSVDDQDTEMSPCIFWSSSMERIMKLVLLAVRL